MQRMQRQGKISFYMQSLGEEAISIGQGLALEDGDMLFPAYRNQGLYILRGTRPGRHDVPVPVEYPGHVQGPPDADFLSEQERTICFTISGNLATQYPQAVGWAMGAAIKGESNISQPPGSVTAVRRRPISTMH